jgi:dihydrofolate reductase
MAMAKLIVTEMVTLDGVAQSPSAPDEDGEDGFAFGGWQVPYTDPDGASLMFEQERTMDALLLGRKTYELFAGYWPTAPDEIPFAGLFNRVPKYVASRTLAEPLMWEGSSIVDGTAEGLRALKDRHDEVHVIGSLDLVQTLLGLGLVDRLNLWVFPVVLGTGKHLFAEGTVPAALRLIESATHPSGTLQLTYETAGEPTYGDLTTAE